MPISKVVVVGGNLNGLVGDIVGVNELTTALVLEYEMWMMRCYHSSMVQQ